jgi:hypothetical protein
MPKKVKAYDLDQVLEMLSAVQEKTDDIAKRLEVIYGLGPALEEREVGELGEVLEAVADVIDDFHYSLASYMQGTGIEFEREEEEEEEKSGEMPAIEQFMEEKLEWEEEEEEEIAPETTEEEEEEIPEFLR